MTVPAGADRPAAGPPGRIRRAASRYIPEEFHDPFGLVARLLRSREPAALVAMATALAGVVLTPVDLALQPAERRRYAKAPLPQRPVIFVCGPPRSGTTLAAQVLISTLPVSYVPNLTAMFPRSPLVATRLLRWSPRRARASFRSYYGKTGGLSGPNDALYLWDRWLGTDRRHPRTQLTPNQQDAMARFFGAFETAHGLPVLNKNNSLDTQAHLVAEALPTARFVCLWRDPSYLAQSLLRARLDIHGTLDRPYGVTGPGDESTDDAVEDVCRQVAYHREQIDEQQRRVGAERFWIVPYESLCQAPEKLVERVAREVLGQPVDVERVRAVAPPFPVHNRVRVEPDAFARIERTLRELGLRA